MNWYYLCVILHLFAVSLWLGHMFFWSIVVGPVTKRIEPPDAGQTLRQLSLRWGGLGWPALALLVLTGIVLTAYRGIPFQHVASGEFLSNPFGRGLAMKLLLVAGMIVYQWWVGHRPAPRLIFVNMIAALMILALSVLMVRAPGIF
jgi:uncharacterized membrane protein